jgi:hypothetical protein
MKTNSNLKKERMIWSGTLLFLFSFLLITVGAFASDDLHKKMGEILANLQANGEYVLSAYVNEANEKGEGKITVKTTDETKIYNQNGQIQESADQSGNKTIYEDGLPAKVVDASGRVVSLTNVQAQPQDGSKLLVSHDCKGNTEQRLMNSQGEMIERIDHQGVAYKNKILKNGQDKTIGVTETNEQSGAKTTRYFDQATGDISGVLNADGSFVQMSYQKDDQGRKLKSAELNTRTGLVTYKAFDEMGREAMVASPDGEVKTITYKTDARGHVNSSVETIAQSNDGSKQAHQVYKVFDGADRVLEERDSRGRTVKYQYILTADKKLFQTIEDETITNESGKKISYHRTRELGPDGRVKSVTEGLHRSTYSYKTDENGIVLSERETKFLTSSNQELCEMLTEKTPQGLPKQVEKWDQFGASAKRYSITTYKNDEVKGKTVETVALNHLGEMTKTTMDANGLPVRSELWQTTGPLLKRHSVSTIKTDAVTKLTVSTESVNDLGERTRINMDEYGVPVKSESWAVLGPLKKRHALTELQTNRETNQTERTVSTNDLGDVTTTVMDTNGLPVSSESQETLGALGGRHKVTKIETDPVSGLTRSIHTTDELRETDATMDANGLAVRSENQDVYGPRLKRHSVSNMENDKNTGVVQSSLLTNDLGDKIKTTMDAGGAAVSGELWNELGALLKKHSTSVISTDPDTGMTAKTVMTNDLGDVSTSLMDGNGITVFSETQNTLGATLKRHSQTKLTSDQVTGIAISSDTTDDLGDRTVVSLDKNGLPVSSESWNVLGPTLKRHSNTTLTNNQDSGMNLLAASVNDLGDRTETKMDKNGLAVSSEAWGTLGAVKKRHSLTAIQTNQSTGMSDSSDCTDDLGDRVLTTMNRDGLGVRSASWNTLGALLKRHSISLLTTDVATGVTTMIQSVNDLGDTAVTRMNAQGLAVASVNKNVLGARKKRSSQSVITCDEKTGMTHTTSNVNELGETTLEVKDQNGFTVNSQTHTVLGPRKKRDTWRTVQTNQETGMPLYSASKDTLGNFSETWMDENGLAVSSHSLDVLGATAGREKNSTVKNRLSTGMPESSESFDALHIGASTTLMDENGLAYYTRSVARYGPTAAADKKTELNTDLDTGVCRASLTSDGLHQGPVATFMDENGLAVSSAGTDLLGATAGRKKITRLENDQDTGITTATYSQDGLHVGESETRMDENGLAFFSHGVDQYGVTNGREKTTYLTTRADIGTSAVSVSYDLLHAGPVTTLMDVNGLAYASSATDLYGAENGRHKETKIHTRPDLGTPQMTETTDGLHAGTVTSWMDKNGFAYRSRSTDLFGANLGKTKTTLMQTRMDLGTSEMTKTSDGLHTGPVTTWLDEDGIAMASMGTDKFGAEAGRKKTTVIDTRRDTGTTRATYSSDGLHDGAVVTLMDKDGLALTSQGIDHYGPKDGRLKATQLTVDKKTGITRSSVTTDGLHAGGVLNEMNENGFAVRSTAVNKYGPVGARLQKIQMTPNPETGLTAGSKSQSLSETGEVITSSETQNDVNGMPETATSESRYGAWKKKSTVFTVDRVSGLTTGSKATDDGGYTVNRHNEFGIEKSMRYGKLGAIKETTTLSTLNQSTGLPASSVSTDRKGQTASAFDQNGQMNVSTRTNLGAHYIPTETTRVATFNIYTGSPLLSTSTDAQGSTEKHNNLDGFLEQSIRNGKWGDQSVTTFTNNKISGLPTRSFSQGESGSTETWYEENGLALHSDFKATFGLNSRSVNYYDSKLDQVCSQSTDERGNLSVSLCNAAGEVTQTVSKTGVTNMDLANNRAEHSSGNGGETSYAYAGRWLDSTTNVNKKGETTTTSMDQRPNGAARSVTTKDGTTEYQNTYNGRGFVTYRTEKKGHDGGFSRFNDYGDQLYTKWTGDIKEGGADEYGNQFLGGKWESETTYQNSPRGDVLSWTTKSSWSGKQKYAEIGHYEFVCDLGYDSKGACIGGHETYKQDQAGRVEGVGGSDPAKTETPDATPETDDWILSHLVSRTTADKIVYTGKPSQALTDFETDATQPGYMEYQKTVAKSLAEQGYAEKLKASLKPMLTNIEGMLKNFNDSGRLMNLFQISSYGSLDAAKFRQQFTQAADKAQFLRNTVDTVYYNFSGKHLNETQLGLQNVNAALGLVNHSATLGALQDWLEFVASAEEQRAVSRLLLATSGQEAGSAGGQLQDMQEKLSGLLQEISLKNLGQSISLDVLKLWLGKTLTSTADANDLASRLSNNLQLAASTDTAGTVGVLLGASVTRAQSSSGVNNTVGLDENLLTAKVLGASVAVGTPDTADLKLVNPALQATPAGTVPKVVPGAMVSSGFDKVAGAFSLKLQQQFAGHGNEGDVHTGNVSVLPKADGGKLECKYLGKDQAMVIAEDARGNKTGVAKYRGGWLQAAAMRDGTLVTVTYVFKPGKDKNLKSADVNFSKGDERTVKKLDGNGNLICTLVKEGNRMKVDNTVKKDNLSAGDGFGNIEQPAKDKRVENIKIPAAPVRPNRRQ